MKSIPLLALILALLLGSQYSDAEESQLGRLFYTPTQRTQLDSLRQHNLAVDRSESPILTIDGEVRRSSGQDSHWINGEVHDGRLGEAQQATIGERINRRSGEQEKLLGNGLLQIHRSHP